MKSIDDIQEFGTYEIHNISSKNLELTWDGNPIPTIKAKSKRNYPGGIARHVAKHVLQAVIEEKEGFKRVTDPRIIAKYTPRVLRDASNPITEEEEQLAQSEKGQPEQEENVAETKEQADGFEGLNSNDGISEDLTKDELIAIAEERGIEINKRDPKAAILEAINNN